MKNIAVLALVLATIALFLNLHSPRPSPPGNRPVVESTYDRVMRKGEIHCGYASWPPLLIKDAATGKISGIVHDYTEALGEALHLKIVWAEEVGWGDFPAALANGRIDAMCAGIWPNASRAREIDFTTPIMYQPIYAYARINDQRFDNNFAHIDDPSVTIVTADGEMGALIAAADAPHAKTLQLSQLASGGENFEAIAANKADVLFTDPTSFGEYDAKNPNRIQRVASARPIRIFGNTIAIAQGQDRFRRMIDTATEELLGSGQLDKIIATYERYPGTILRVAPLYAPK